MPFLMSQRNVYMQALLSATYNRLLLTAMAEQLKPDMLPDPVRA